MIEKVEHKGIMSNLYFTFFLLSACLFLIFVLIDLCAGPRWDVIDFYRIAENVKSGLIPYRDFQYEFPPFQLLFICFPIIFTDSIEVYSMFISIMSCISCILTMFILVKIGKELNLDRILLMMLFAIIVLIFSYCISAKTDAFVMLIITSAIYLYIKNRPAFAVAVSIFGALFKMTPIILTVIFFIMMIFTGDRVEKVKNIVKSIMCSFIVIIAAVIPFICMNTSLSQIFSFIGQHSGRGVHTESTFGVIARFFNELGLIDITRTLNMGCMEVTSEFCSVMASFSIPIMIIIFVAFIIFICITLKIHGMPTTRVDKFRILLLSFVIMMLVFLLTTKIFSTQYLIWLLPAILLLELISNDKKLGYRIIVWCAIYAVSLLGMIDDNCILFVPLFTIRLIVMIFLTFDYFMDLYEMFNPDVFKTNKNTTVSE